MKNAILVAFLLLAQSVFAQVKPDFFPEDVSSEGVGVRCFCKPGVRNKSRSKGLDISYGRLGNGTFKDEECKFTAPLSQYKTWQQFEIDLKVPVINKDNFKLLLGYKYRSESFDLSRFGGDFTETFRGLDASNLKNNSLSAIVTKPLNETKYLAFRLRYTASGNYSGLMDFGSDYAIYKWLALFGVKRDENFEWGIGMGGSSSFRRTTVLPLFLYNRNFNDRWGIESGLPGYIFGRYNLSKKSILLFGAEYNSDSYRLKVKQPSNGVLDYALNHSEVLGMLRLEQQIAPWIWGNVKAGYQLNFSSDFESKSVNTTSFKVEPSDGLFFQIGVFISPPDRFFQGE